MKQPEDATDLRIMQTGQPTTVAMLRIPKLPAKHFDEKRFC